VAAPCYCHSFKLSFEFSLSCTRVLRLISLPPNWTVTHVPKDRARLAGGISGAACFPGCSEYGLQFSIQVLQENMQCVAIGNTADLPICSQGPAVPLIALSTDIGDWL
jgi:hypothetical protein